MGPTSQDWALSGAKIGAGLGVVESLIMVYVRVPMVMATRPGLREAGLITGVLSAYPGEYLFYHYPLLAAAVAVVISGLVWTFLAMVFGSG